MPWEYRIRHSIAIRSPHSSGISFVWSWTILRSACWAERNQKKRKFRGWHNLVNGFVIIIYVKVSMTFLVFTISSLFVESLLFILPFHFPFSGLISISGSSLRKSGCVSTRASLGWSFMRGKGFGRYLFIDNWLCPSSANHFKAYNEYCRLERRAEAWQWHVRVTQVDIYTY